MHIGLNQLRRLLNKIIEVYGKTDQIVIELAGVEATEQQKQDAITRIKDATSAVKERSEKLKHWDKDNGQPMLLRLWEDRTPRREAALPLYGKRISEAMISMVAAKWITSCLIRALGRQFANRTLCLREANREKRNQIPWEVWGGQRIGMIETNGEPARQQTLAICPGCNGAVRRREGFSRTGAGRYAHLARISRSYLDTLFTEGGRSGRAGG